jgi:hypothetical protein
MVLIDTRREEMMKTLYIEVQGGRDLNGPYSPAQEIGLISAWICFFLSRQMLFVVTFWTSRQD